VETYRLFKVTKDDIRAVFMTQRCKTVQAAVLVSSSHIIKEHEGVEAYFYKFITAAAGSLFLDKKSLMHIECGAARPHSGSERDAQGES
jgi:hypothetical protein